MTSIFTEDQKSVMKKISYDAAERVADRMEQKMESNLIPKIVRKTLQELGHDTTDPVSSQADQAHLRRLRQRAEKWEEAKISMWFKILGTLATTLIIAYFSFTLGSSSVKADVKIENVGK